MVLNSEFIKMIISLMPFPRIVLLSLAGPFAFAYFYLLNNLFRYISKKYPTRFSSTSFTAILFRRKERKFLGREIISPKIYKKDRKFVKIARKIRIVVIIFLVVGIFYTFYFQIIGLFS